MASTKASTRVRAPSLSGARLQEQTARSGFLALKSKSLKVSTLACKPLQDAADAFCAWSLISSVSMISSNAPNELCQSVCATRHIKKPPCSLHLPFSFLTSSYASPYVSINFSLHVWAVMRAKTWLGVRGHPCHKAESISHPDERIKGLTCVQVFNVVTVVYIDIVRAIVPMHPVTLANPAVLPMVKELDVRRHARYDTVNLSRRQGPHSHSCDCLTCKSFGFTKGSLSLDRSHLLPTSFPGGSLLVFTKSILMAAYRGSID